MFGKSKEPKEPKPKKEKKPKREKKPKKEKPPKEKKAKEPKAKDGKGKKGPNKLLLLLPLVLVIAAAAFFFLKGGKEEEPEEPAGPELPAEYMVGETAIPGLTVDETEKEVQAILAKTVTYTYKDLLDAGGAASGYMTQLNGEGFSVVDEAFVRTEDRPDFKAQEGSLLLAKNIKKEAPAAAAEGEETTEPVEQPDLVNTVRISWTPGVCVVTADEEEGIVTSPPPEESGGLMGASISVTDALDYLKGMPPERLGLTGDTMDNYKVYVQDGAIYVNEQPCIRMNVYDDNNVQGGNAIAGCYLMSSDGLHLYRLDEVNRTVEEIPME